MSSDADNHIFKFLMNKFYNDSTDFETQLYLCSEAFRVRKNETVSFRNINTGYSKIDARTFTAYFSATFTNATVLKFSPLIWPCYVVIRLKSQADRM